MASHYELNVVTPQGTVYTGTVRHTLLPSDRGFVGVLANHAPYVTSCAKGTLEIEEQNGEIKKVAIGAGFFSVTQNKATLLTEEFDKEESETA